MIPDFKTYIGESVWSDIHKRSNGKTVRKEDDIDFMSAEELYNYIKDTYLFKSTSDIFIDEKRDRIVINLYDVAGGRESYLSLNGYDEKYIILSDLYTKHMQDLLNAYYHVGERSFRNPALDDFIIRPKDDGEITNKFFIEVLDFLIDNADNTHQPNLYPANKFRKNESVWSDIHRRSNGEQFRKEDIINNFTLEELCDYLNENYKVSFHDKFLTGEDHNGLYLYAPLVPRYGIILHITDNEEKHIVFNKNLEKEIPDFYNLIDSKYFITSCDFNEDLKCIYQSGDTKLKVDNNFYIEVLDFLIDKYNGTKRIKRK